MQITAILGIDYLRWKLELIDLFMLAIALGIDCFIVSFSQGLIFKHNRLKNSLNLALTMGLFQGLMPIIGYIGTDYLYKLLIPYSKWIVFTIFFALGMKFIFEAFQPQKEEIYCIGWKCLIGLGVATSIDALVSGATIRLTQTNISFACAIIGIMSFLMAICGFWLGNFVKNLPSKYLEISGGVILILLAIKAIL